MAWAEHVRFYLDAATFGGLVPERLLCALPIADGLWCGLVFTLSGTGKPYVDYWERLDDLERQGFVPISASKARAICDALPRFLDRLEQAQAASDERTAVG